MKNRTKKIISTLMAVVLAVSLLAFTIIALAGCGDDSEKNSVYTTYSNGGSAVEHGDYVYFINGIGGFPSTDITEDVNVAGEVEKGGLYRVKKHEAILRYGDDTLPKEVTDNYIKHQTIDLESSELDWKDLRNYTISDYHDWDADKNRYVAHFEKTRDDTEYHVTGSNVELISGKIIGTNNYAGGIFIFDERIYFASPANTLDKEGKYQYNKVDFFTCTLDGKNLTKLYTTTGTTDSAAHNATEETEEGEEAEAEIVSIPYNFTKQNGKVYLTTFEQWYANDDDEAAGKMTGYIVTTEIANGLINRKTIVANNVLGVYFPVKDTYIPGASTNTIYDFIYFIRKAENDVNNYGTVIEMMRPNGDDREMIIGNNKTATIEGISGDYFYYRINYDKRTTLEYTTLRAQLENSSYERTKNSNGDTVIKTVDGVPVKKSGGKTFIDEQAALKAGYDAWLSEGRPAGDARFTAYDNGYILPMTDANYVLIDNLNESNRTITGIFLIPHKASRNVSNVYVVAATSDRMFNIGKDGIASLICSSAFTGLIVDDNKIYGFDANNQFGYIFISASDAQEIGYNARTYPAELNYMTVSNGTYLMMDLLPIHDRNGNLIDSYAVYFTNYPSSEKATNYMVMMKISGKNCGQWYSPTPVGYVIPEERKAIICADPDCIDYTHDHTARDGFEPGVDPNAEEEESTDQMSMM